jgi:hypothetical protein
MSKWQERRKALKGADVTTLKAALTDPNRFVRLKAIEKLRAHLDEPGVQEALIKRLSDRSEQVRASLINDIPHFGPQALPALEQLLLKESRYLLSQAAPFLATMAERHPHPGQRIFAMAIKKQAKMLWMVPRARRRLREAVDRIERATQHLKDMPIVAEAPTAAKSLPLPAAEPNRPDVGSLPIPWWQAIFRRDP